MTAILLALLVGVSHPSASRSGAIVSFFVLAVIAVFALVRVVLGGNQETNSRSLSPSSSDSIVEMESDVPGANPYRFHKEMPEVTAVLQPKNDYGRNAVSYAADAEFEATILETIPIEAQEKAFYVKVRGTSYRNIDRTFRTRIIEQCAPFDSLTLLPQPEAPEHPDAERVCRSTTPEQLGYLESRLGEEISRDMLKHGPRWVAFFRRKTQHPESGRTVGAVIRLIRLSDEFIAKSDAVRFSQVK